MNYGQGELRTIRLQMVQILDHAPAAGAQNVLCQFNANADLADADLRLLS